MTDSCSTFILEINVQTFSIILWLILEMNKNNIFLWLRDTLRRVKEYFKGKKVLHFRIFFLQSYSFFSSPNSNVYFRKEIFSTKRNLVELQQNS